MTDPFHEPMRWGETDCIEWMREGVRRATGEKLERPRWLTGTHDELVERYATARHAAASIAKATGRRYELGAPAALEAGDIVVAERLGKFRFGVVMGPGDVVYRTRRGLTARGGRVVARVPAGG